MIDERGFLERFEKSINDLITSGVSFNNKIEKINWLLIQECEYWNKKGDNSTISKLKDFSTQAISFIANQEIVSIPKRLENPEKIAQSMKQIRDTISKVTWLDESFKSRINIQLALAGHQ